MYATLEAEAFAARLAKLNLLVPHLSQILAFECAITMILMDGETRMVHLDFEPIPMLRALADGRLYEEVPQAGEFEIEITPNRPTAAAGLTLADVQSAFHLPLMRSTGSWTNKGAGFSMALGNPSNHSRQAKVPEEKARSRSWR